MLNKRPLVCFTDTDGKFVVLGGNMRLKAAKDLGLKELPIILADEWTEEQKAEFLIKDNVGFGEWDWNELNTDWDTEQLEGWGLDVPVFEVSKQQKSTDESEYDFENFDSTGITTIKIVLPDEKAQQLVDKIDAMKGIKTTSEYIYEHFCN
jgi:ParB-like chromosome segregation protein Spo0J